MGLALPLQLWHTGRRFPVAGRLQCSVQCASAMQGGSASGAVSAVGSVGTGTRGHPTVRGQHPSLERAAMGRSSAPAASAGDVLGLAQGAGLPSDRAAAGRCCADRRGVQGLCGAAAPRGGSRAVCGVGSGAPSLRPRAGHCPGSCGAVGRGQRPTCSAGWVMCGAPASLQRRMGGAFAGRSWQCFTREGRAALSLLWQCPVSLQCWARGVSAGQAVPRVPAVPHRCHPCIPGTAPVPLLPLPRNAGRAHSALCPQGAWQAVSSQLVALSVPMSPW